MKNAANKANFSYQMREFDRFSSFTVKTHKKSHFLEKCHFWDNSYRNADNYNTSEAKMKLETYSKSSLHRLYLCILWQTLNFYLFMSKTALENIVSLSITVGITQYSIVAWW